jgi:hypothetical protein
MDVENGQVKRVKKQIMIAFRPNRKDKNPLSKSKRKENIAI